MEFKKKEKAVDYLLQLGLTPKSENLIKTP